MTDSHGKYVKTLVLGEALGGRRIYWNPVSVGVEPRFLLNVGGDIMGDGPPVVVEQPGTRQPWVVWSASDGQDREIAVATWSQGRWQGPELVERLDNTIDDLGPRLAFDGEGRPVVTWWRNEPVPRIYLSTFRNGVWSTPISISDPATPSRFPSIRVQGSSAIVSFSTPRGRSVLYRKLSELPVFTEGNGPLDGPVPPPDVITPPGGVDDTGTVCVGDCSPGAVLQKPSEIGGT
ncbi:MAG TPA: hypothetical protein VGR38_08020 [Candidatus Polarisedimenticolia bacterium]|nr:hypothetical protein [Candidatus Polarisedimenticolia bacterium]